jgi:hypothetical protein
MTMPPPVMSAGAAPTRPASSGAAFSGPAGAQRGLPVADLEATVAEDDRSYEDHDGGEDGLSPEKTRFVEAIVEGQSVADAAKVAGRSPRTGRRWKTEPEVAGAIRARLSEAMAQARAVLAAGSVRAARSLVSMADGSAEPARVSAAKAVIESASRLCEIQELEERLAELEEQLALDGTRKGRA